MILAECELYSDGAHLRQSVLSALECQPFRKIFRCDVLPSAGL